MKTTAGKESERSPAWYFWAGALLLAAGVLGVFGPGIHGGFLYWDDHINIFENPNLGGLSWARVVWAWTDSAQSFRFMPLGWLGYSAVFSVGGLDPAYYHAATLLMHLINAVLLFGVLRLQLQITQPAVDSGWRELGAWFAAAVWVFHPLRVEVVAWTLTLTYELAWCGVLLAWVGLLKFWVTGRRSWMIATVAAYTASLLVYPVGISTWLAFFVLVAWLVRRGAAPPVAKWRVILPVVALPGVVVTGLALWIRWHATGPWEGPTNLHEFGMGERIGQTAYAWAYYVWRPWWPVDVAPIYGTLLRIDPLAARFVLSGLLVVAGTLLTWVYRRKWPGLAAWWFAMAALALPVMGLTEHPFFTSDRFTGLPGLALAALLAGLWSCVASRTSRWLLGAVATGWLIVLVMLSVQQVPRWNNTTRLFSYVASIATDPAVRLESHQRQALVAEANGDYAEARRELEKGLAIVRNQPALVALAARLAAPAPPISKAAETQLALARMASARHDASAAEAHFRRAIALEPRLREARIRLGLLLLDRLEPREALRHFVWVGGGGAANLDRQFLSAAAAAADEVGDVPLAHAVRRQLARMDAQR